MQNSNYKKLMALALLVTGSASALAAQNAYAEDVTDPAADSSTTLERQGPHPFDGNVERSVEEIENGVVITLTTDDADTLEKLQSMPEEAPEDAPFGDEVTREITLLDNGVQITLTSEDADVVEKLQNMPDKPVKPDFKNLDIDRTVENTENGVVITLTSEDPDVVEMLQNRADDEFFMGGGHPRHEHGEDDSVEE